MNKKKNPQGRRWRKLDNTGKLFSIVTNENLSNVFRISVTLKSEVIPQLLQKALEETVLQFDTFRVRLHKGFFWYYFETNKRTPLIEEEATYPCKYIDPHSNQMFLFRVSYYECRINLEVFHAITDGLGAVRFIQALTRCYLDLLKAYDKTPKLKENPSDAAGELKDRKAVAGTEDSYAKNYKKLRVHKYSSKKAFSIKGRQLPLDAENIVHGYVNIHDLKRVSKGYGVSITKYLLTVLIWVIYQEYRPDGKWIGINLPVNLRSFFDSATTANFFVVTTIEYLVSHENITFPQLLELVSQQMDDKIVKDKLEETISYNVSNEKKWYVRIVPLFIKWAALNVIFWRNDRSYTMTLSNIGLIAMEPEYEKEIERFHLILGVSKRQPVKCGVCAYGEELEISFTSVYRDMKIQNGFYHFLRSENIPVETESNGLVEKKTDRGMYPSILYDEDGLKKGAHIFYAVSMVLALILGMLNLALTPGEHWSFIAIAGIIYGMVTFRYSVTRQSNLGFKMLVQVVGAQLFMVAMDFSLGYRGWSINYAIPSSILFADIAVVGLMVVNRLNWQSYFMYQISITVFSFIPIILWLVGLITVPLLSWLAVAVSGIILIATILLGDRSVKRELKRRFHI